jgi:hypothetical protein
MAYDLITAETALSELPLDTRVWIVCDPAAPGTVVTFNVPNSEKKVTWIFLKREDADHFKFLLNQSSPQHKDSDLVVEGPRLQDIFQGATEGQRRLALIPPNTAKKFFEDFAEEFLWHYYK